MNFMYTLCGGYFYSISMATVRRRKADGEEESDESPTTMNNNADERSKRPQLTLLEEVFLLGLKDSQVT